ncbi:hypothetical protein CDAR_189131 [Caerostris darwini]|uniref:Uncharacterized protein n=1 Tax=Caerostris darwini TaxID=1538125 RepID=A0AAV4SSE3_9ARAC|nr:hypothetical protein CDAR_189131 [Caerostris darwini]
MAKVKGDSYNRQLRDLFGRWRCRLKEADSQNKQDLPDVMNELFLGAMFLARGHLRVSCGGYLRRSAGAPRGLGRIPFPQGGKGTLCGKEIPPCDVKWGGDEFHPPPPFKDPPML